LGSETVRKFLKDFGLTEKEGEVYIFLAKRGTLRSGEIVKGIKTHKGEVYRVLKSLQTKGLVESTIEFPTRFTAVPFETALDSFIKIKKEEVSSVENARQELLNDWKSISKTGVELPLEKFVVIEGNRRIYPKILQMIQQTRNRFSAISTVTGLLRAEQFGLFDAIFGNPLKSKIQFRFLTELSYQNLDAAKALLKRTPKAVFDFKGRNPELGLQLSPRMVIRDEEEILFFITSKDAPGLGKDEMCMWTNCKALVDSFSAVFEDLWNNSTDLEQKIIELETGKPSQNTHVISDAETARRKYEEILRSAKEEIIMVTSAEGIVSRWKKMAMLREWAKDGISIKIMAPITSENLNAAQELAKFGEIRHVPASYLETTIVDGRHLFQFKNRPPDEKKPRAQHFGNAFYTSDLEYVEKTKNMLSYVWQNAGGLSTIPLESIIGVERVDIAKFSETPWRKVNGFTLIEENKGAITEKDVLNKIINAQKIPAKSPLKDVNVLYGSLGIAVIHPPDYFKLPDMLISAWHIDKQSSWGAEDMVCIHLWLETPTGYAYVPVVTIGDNPKAVEYRRRAPSPDKNHQLAKKDEVYVRVHGNTLFAGWTVPIPLSPHPYILPPSFMRLEGHGTLKTGAFRLKPLWGPQPRTHIYEFNGLEAFVTFMHPAAKYTGPGTDGLLYRDLVAIFSPHEKTDTSLNNDTKN
jgi:sugar-specific transcriptional regulator TrmB